VPAVEPAACTQGNFSYRYDYSCCCGNAEIIVVTQILNATSVPATSPGTLERKNQTLRVLESLRYAINEWVRVSERNDTNRQYVTQISTLATQLGFLLDKVDAQIRAVPASQSERSTYSAMRLIERRLLWIQRIWRYFQTKFDQRGDPALAPTLKAADEIVWSCYAQPFRAAGVAVPAVPLPFVALAFSPYAIPRDEPPQELRSDVDGGFLNAMLTQLPLPVTGFPPVAVDEPWWLAYLAHEIGHHVQFDLNAGAMLGAFADTLEAAGGARWRGWGKELFADCYSLLMIGPWALWALAELVWGEPADMLDDSNPRYPCALVRLVFMSEVANRLGFDGTSALRGLNVENLLAAPAMSKNRDLRVAATADLGNVAHVAQAVTSARYTQSGTLQDMAQFEREDFLPGGNVALWSKALRGEGAMVPNGYLKSARLVLGAGVGAWSAIRNTADEAQRAKRRLLLQEKLIESIVASREEIVRLAHTPAADEVDTRNDRLAGLLLADLPEPGM